jgi:T-complex protein 1 subunit beta
MIKTTLGPKGMDKILKPLSAGPRDDSITVTNDGATILKSIHLDNPAAKVLIDISKIQDQEVGDGTTTVCVLAGELLREGERLINAHIHPQIIISGWRVAVEEARKALVHSSMNNSKDEAKFREDLMNIARTTLSSKLVSHEKEFFSNLAVDAVLRLRGSSNLEHIHIIKKPGGNLHDSQLVNGILLEKQITTGCPRRKENPKILVANTPMDYDKIKIYGTKVKTESMTKIAEIEAEEKNKMRAKVEKILKFEPDVFINRQLIYNFPEQLLADKNIMVIEHADFEGVERLAYATGGEILSTFDAPERAKDVLGSCELIEEIMIGEDKLIKFSGCKKGESCTLVLRGASKHVLDEAERSIHDALCVLVTTVKHHNTIYGGGHTEMLMAEAVEKRSKEIAGKQALAVAAFATALRALPTIIADNGGYDSADLVQRLKYEIAQGNKTAGLDMNNGEIGCMKELGI